MGSTPPPLVRDLTRIWRADQRGVVRPRPDGSRDEVRALLAAYEQAAAEDAGDSAAVELYDGRMVEIRAYLDGGAK